MYKLDQVRLKNTASIWGLFLPNREEKGKKSGKSA